MALAQCKTRFSNLVMAFAALLFAATPAMASQIFYFSFAGNSVSGSGTLNAEANGDGTFTAVSGGGTQTIGGVTDHLTLIFNPNGEFIASSPSGLLAFDNQLFPANSPMLSDAGLLFQSFAQEVNLYSNGGGYEYFRQGGFPAEAITFALSDAPTGTVPEPTSVLLLGIGVISYCASRRKHSRLV